MFSEQSNAEVGPTSLLFQTIQVHEKIECHVLQKFVESRVTCSKMNVNSSASCTVTAQRPSEKPRPSEHLSILNIPQEFLSLSFYFPRATGNIPGIAGDGQLNYILTGSPLKLDGCPGCERDGHVGTRLSQLLNSYLMTSRLSFTPVPIDGEDEQGGTWATVSALTDDNLYVYSVSAPWMIACIASCLILFIGGVLGILFNHMNQGPELLGYVSAILRDSRFVDTSVSMDGLDAAQVAVLMKQHRFRYGKYQLGVEERMGIGPEDEIVPIGGH